MLLYLFPILLVSIYECASLKLPNYIKPCSRSDPNFNACAIGSARAAIPVLLNGDRKIGLPSFNPFKISHVDLIGGDNLKLALNNLNVYGLDKLKILDIRVDFKTGKARVVTSLERVDVIADYVINGRILFLPLQGNGPCNITLFEGTYEYNFILDFETRNGKKYVKLDNNLSTYNYDVKKVIFKLENLFNGDKRLGEETNKLLNESWRELNQELMPSINQALIDIYGSVASAFYKNIPYDDIVLP